MPSRIFEVFGFPIGDGSPRATTHRQRAICPFMQKDCDGGGNRYLSNIDLRPKPELQQYFQGSDHVVSGVCSLQLKEDERPWIVCPRRLLVLGRGQPGQTPHQEAIVSRLLIASGYPARTRIGVWPEVKIKYHEHAGGVRKSFDYTFDYVLVPVRSVDAAHVQRVTGKFWGVMRPVLEQAGYTIARRGGTDYVDDFPEGPPLVVEIMTSSTSGGNKRKRTTIPMAFEDVIMGRRHQAPGINYRQVWARMVSQLVVKSEVAIGWGGKTIWILQDALVDYISSSTALDIRQFASDSTSEVNILALSYGDSHTGPAPGRVIELRYDKLYAGPISSSRSRGAQSFQDIIRAPVKPPLSRLLVLLMRRQPMNYLTVP